MLEAIVYKDVDLAEVLKICDFVSCPVHIKMSPDFTSERLKDGRQKLIFKTCCEKQEETLHRLMKILRKNRRK